MTQLTCHVTEYISHDATNCHVTKIHTLTAPCKCLVVPPNIYTVIVLCVACVLYIHVGHMPYTSGDYIII